jgi:hypothetical protein
MTAAPAAIDLYIRTYFRDLRWLHLSLLSVARFVEGYRRIIVVMPRSSAERLRSEQIPDPARTTVVYCDDYADDYIGQQISKLHADLDTDAAMITHLDSDCLFHSPCNLPALIAKDGRPIIRVLTQSRRPASDGWRSCIIDLHGRPLPFDPLTPAPWTYTRDLYASLRETCHQRHHTPLKAWCLARRCDTVSEFSLLVAQAWFHHRDQYHWVAADSHLNWPCMQYWSRSPRANEVRAALAYQLTQP